MRTREWECGCVERRRLRRWQPWRPCQRHNLRPGWIVPSALGEPLNMLVEDRARLRELAKQIYAEGSGSVSSGSSSGEG